MPLLAASALALAGAPGRAAAATAPPPATASPNDPARGGRTDPPQGDGAGARSGAAPASREANTREKKGRGRGQTGDTPPRFDGWYLSSALHGTVTWARVNDLATPRPFAGYSGAIRVGQVVLPWLALGLEFWGGMSRARGEDGAQRLGQGGLMADLTVFPIPRRGLSLRLGFGLGGGAVREDGTPGRTGFGGPLFTAQVAYVFFPLSARKRPHRGGGWGIGPELAYFGATPAAAGRPMAHTLALGLRTTFYFGS